MADRLTIHLDDAPLVTAPDGMDVRVLNALAGGSMAEFRLPEGGVGRCIRHPRVEEIWFVTAGSGEMWREGIAGGVPVALRPGLCLSIPVRTAFQVRALAGGLAAVAVTMPPWGGEEDAEILENAGPWVPTA